MAAMGAPAAVSDAMKNRRRTATKTKRPGAPKVRGRRNPSSTNASTTIALLKRERDEALEQLSAASEVLKVISSSPGDLKPVFEAILEKATHICEANFGILFCLDDGVVHVGATLGVPLALTKFMQSVRRPGPHSATARAMRTGRVIHILDAREERGYREGDPMLVFGVDKVGIRTLVAAPMLKDKEPIGSIGIYRTEVRPFTDKQIELVRNFAAQAVIAIENTRLLNELRESLEQQTATSEVLSVISSSPGELEPVFAAMLRNAVQLCDAKFGNIYRWDGEALHLVAGHNTPTALAEARRHIPLRPAIDSLIGRMITTKTAIHVDAATHQGYADRSDPGAMTAVELGGVRTVLAVPMLKEDELIGSFTVYRQEPRPFTEKQIALVTNFAAQAVIAIENTRLLNELRQRTTPIAGAADGDIRSAERHLMLAGRVGAGLPGHAGERGTDLRGQIRIYESIRWRHLESCSSSRCGAGVRRIPAAGRISAAGPETVVARIARTNQIVHIADLVASQGYAEAIRSSSPLSNLVVFVHCSACQCLRKTN